MLCRSQALAAVCLAVLFFLAPADAQVNVLTYHNDLGRTGQNTNETSLTPANVNATNFGKLFSQSVDGYVYAQPLYVFNLAIPGQGAHNVVFISTEHNSVYAFDADAATGPAQGMLWHTNLGPSAVTPNADFGNRYGSYKDITNEVGITGTPVIDLASGTLYVDAFTHEGSAYYHRIHALDITTGVERPPGPVLVTASFPGVGVGSVGGVQIFNPLQEIQRSALTLAGGILYVCYAGYADTNPFHGWIVGFNAATLQQLTNFVFNTTPNSSIATYGTNAGEGGIWMGGGGIAVDAATNLYLSVGNGIFDNVNNTSGTEYADTLLKLSTSNQLAVADYFTPYDQATLAFLDEDFGSGGVMLIPDQTGPYPHLLVTAGKEGRIYLVNRDLFTVQNVHYDGFNHVDHVLQSVSSQLSPVYDTPTWFNGLIYFAGKGDQLKAFSFGGGMLSTVPVLTSARSYPAPGATASISANGTNNSILWALQMGSPGVLVAYNATNLAAEIYNTTQAATNRDALPNGVKYSVPTVANGKVYVGGQFALTVFGSFAGALAFNSPSYSVDEDSNMVAITVNRTGGTLGPVQVSYATVVSGTAIPGTNYVATNGVLNWTDGDANPKSFNIAVLDDDLAEPNLTVNLALSAPTGGASLGGQSTAVLTIVKNPTATWRYANFGTNGNNPEIAGDFADPTGDGAVNLLKYALALNPNIPNTNSTLSGRIVGSHLDVSFQRDTSASDLTYIVEASTIPQSWTPVVTYTAADWVTNAVGAIVSESAPVGASPNQYVIVTITDPANPAAPGSVTRFLRLRIHR